MKLPARILISCFALAAALAATPANAQRQSGAAAFMEGFANSMRDATQANQQRATTELIRLETQRLQDEKAALEGAKNRATQGEFLKSWRVVSVDPLTNIGKRQRANDKPEEWSDDSLALAGASSLSENVIEVYRVSDLSPGLALRLQSGSTVDRMAIDCKKGTLTGLEVGFFQLSNGLGNPTNHLQAFSILTKPFASSWVETIYEKSCGRLAELNWDAEVGRFITVAKATDGMDYRRDPQLMGELNKLVKLFGAEASDRGMSDEGLAASKWALRQAHELMKTHHLNK